MVSCKAFASFFVVAGCFCLWTIVHFMPGLKFSMNNHYPQLKSQDERTPTATTIEADEGSDKSEQSRNITCAPQKHFVFCKTHKTGSSYVYQILDRLTSNYQLKIAEGPAFHLGGYPGRIRPQLTLIPSERGDLRRPKQGDQFVIINHFRFSRESLDNMMPKDTRYFSIVREPWSNFQSAFHYYHTYRKMKPTHGLQACITYPYFHIAKGRKITFEEYLNVVFDELNASIPWFFRSKNFQSFDLGLDPLLDDDTEIAKAVRQLDTEIDVMLIAEYMDESLILLKDLLCLSWTDIAYTPRTAKRKNYTRMKLSAESPILKRFNDFSKLDVRLYEHFNRTFWHKVEAYGKENMKQDVQKLRSLREKDKSRTVIKQVDISAFKQTPEDEKIGIELYEESLTLLDPKVIFERTIEVLQDNIYLKTKKERTLLANQYMQNYGGCPFTGT